MSTMDEKIRKAMEIIHEHMRGSDIRWILVGSTHMALEGMAVAPNDLDVATSYDDLMRIPVLFPEYTFSDISPLKNGAGGGKMQTRIEGTEVEFMGEPAQGIYTKRMDQGIRYLTFDGMDLPVLSLEAEAGAYEEMGRDHKARMIYDFLSKER